MKRRFRRMEFGDVVEIDIPKGGKVTVTHTGNRGDKVNLSFDVPSDAELVPQPKLDEDRPEGVLS